MKIYIASPYTSYKDKLKAVENQIEAANKILDLGHFPFVPLFSHYFKEQSYDFWLRMDIEFLKVCDAVLRLPGESKGADFEVKMAKYFNIPVYYNLEEI